MSHCKNYLPSSQMNNNRTFLLDFFLKPFLMYCTIKSCKWETLCNDSERRLLVKCCPSSCVQYIFRQCASSAQSRSSIHCDCSARSWRAARLMFHISLNLRCFADLFFSLISERSRTPYIDDCTSIRIWQILLF